MPQRAQVVALARRLLCDQAGLLLLVTPLSTDRCARCRPRGTRRWLLACFAHVLLLGCMCRSHRPERALPILKEWRAAIEALGFSRVAAARLPTVHGLAFRAVPPQSPPRQLAPLRIAYDALGELNGAGTSCSAEEDADGA